MDGKVNLEKELEILSKHRPNFDDTMKAKVAECVNTGEFLFSIHNDGWSKRRISFYNSKKDYRKNHNNKFLKIR